MKPWKILAAVTAVAFCLSVPAVAADDSVEIVIGGVNVQGDSAVDDAGYAFSTGWDSPFGRTGRVSGHLALARQATAVGAWTVDLGARANWGDGVTSDGDPAGRVRGYLEGKLAGVWQDSVAQDVQAGETTVEVTSADQYLSAAAALGLRLYFDRARTIGLGVEGSYSRPINAHLAVDDVRSYRLFLILPVTVAAPAP